MSKQSRLEAKQRMMALDLAFKTPLNSFGSNPTEQVVDAANTYLKFLQGGARSVGGFGPVEFKGFDSGITADRIADDQVDTARRANESIEAAKPTESFATHPPRSGACPILTGLTGFDPAARDGD